ncbi:RNB domain-containing ribonuclease [Nocardioides dongxiaopingii]|uniref:RNB domain-containing ribonuclease n=1 Tax=Nocardioides sp. S-1144 TaxID=2582905 RepID=UPI00110E7C87|nr:RNB domain-containing ribonuclease [Nocardioides sp. S-1144]QCW51163.1 RNB domain-containing ribonuclease [Nocardioides sp. S-1144]
MPSSRVVHVRTDDSAVVATLRQGIERIRTELEVTAEFPPEVEEAAARAAAAPRLPDLDRTELPFVTIDPASSQDLDQAVHVERDGEGGYVVHYAIADLAAFITPGDPVDLEAHRRGQTLYGADSKVPLHPTVLSEDAASLLPEQVRPALLWTIRVDDTGEGTDIDVVRARVRSTAKLSYTEAQAAIDDGTAVETLQLVKEIGEKRLARDAARGGVSLPLPEQEIDTADGEGGAWRLEFRTLLPIEDWNAQISLLTGFGAASLMVYARVGLLRTLPLPDPRDVQRLHRTARALGVDWPAEMLYPDFIRSLDPGRPDHAAVVLASARLLRGSGYVAFDGEVPAEPQHAALVSEYAHVTAPLRRLADRYAAEVCVALCAGEPVPAWVLAALPALPQEMQASGRRASSYERAVVDLVEAGLLVARVGEEFDGVVVAVEEKDERRGKVVVSAIGVEAPVDGDGPVPLGKDVRVRLEQADVETRTVRFSLV